MLTLGPGDLAIWQWLALLASLVVGYLLGRMVAAVIARVATAMTSHTTTQLDDELRKRLLGPLRGMLTIAAMRLLVPLVELHAKAAAIATGCFLAAFAVMLVWGVLRTIDVVTSRLTGAAWALARPASRALLSLMSRIAKVIVIIIAGIGFLSALSFPVASLIAGLGIGGIALAFGAQKTVENLFGAVAIGIDQPLREGDFVLVDGNVMGTVEAVGLRSTRIRTLDRTVISLPNGKLADMKIETFAERDRCRLSTTINLVYETTASQLRDVLSGFERVLREHPNIWPDDVIVRFVSLGTSSLDVEIMAWFKTTNWSEFRTWRQEVLFKFMEVVEQSGSAFAFPTRTVHVVGKAA